jgi:hypothetical protein
MRPSAAIFLFHGGIPPCIYLGAGDSSAYGGLAQDLLRMTSVPTFILSKAGIFSRFAAPKDDLKKYNFTFFESALYVIVSD